MTGTVRGARIFISLYNFFATRNADFRNFQIVAVSLSPRWNIETFPPNRARPDTVRYAGRYAVYLNERRVFVAPSTGSYNIIYEYI